MWINRKEFREFKSQLEEVQMANLKLESSNKILLMKVAGLEATLDRLERECPERTGVDRFLR